MASIYTLKHLQFSVQRKQIWLRILHVNDRENGRGKQNWTEIHATLGTKTMNENKCNMNCLNLHCKHLQFDV